MAIAVKNGIKLSPVLLVQGTLTPHSAAGASG